MNRLTEAFDKFNMTEENRIQKVKEIIEQAIIDKLREQKKEFYRRTVILDIHSFRECYKEYHISQQQVFEAFGKEGHEMREVSLMDENNKPYDVIEIIILDPGQTPAVVIY